MGREEHDRRTEATMTINLKCATTEKKHSPTSNHPSLVTTHDVLPINHETTEYIFS